MPSFDTDQAESADYERTLAAWRDNVDRAWPTLGACYDERFRRMWKYYLAASIGSFRARQIQLWQLVLSPNGVVGGMSLRGEMRTAIAFLGDSVDLRVVVILALSEPTGRGDPRRHCWAASHCASSDDSFVLPRANGLISIKC